MASGTINNPYVLEDITVTKATNKIPSGDYDFRVMRCGNVVQINGWFHNTTQIAENETLFTFTDINLSGVDGFCSVVKGSNVGVCEYSATSFLSRSTLAAGYWNLTTIHIFTN